MKNIFEYDLDNRISFIKYSDKGNSRFSGCYCVDPCKDISELIEVLQCLRDEQHGITKKSILLCDPPLASLAPYEKFQSWKKLRIEKISEDENIGLFPYENNSGIAIKMYEENIVDFIETLRYTLKNNQEQSFIFGNNEIFIAA